MATAQSPEFKQAALDAKNLKAKPSQDEMLQVRAACPSFLARAAATNT